MKQQYGIKCIISDEAPEWLSASYDSTDWIETRRGWERWHKSPAFPYDNLNSAYAELQCLPADNNSCVYSVDELSVVEANILSAVEPRKTSNVVAHGATGPIGFQGVTGISQPIQWTDGTGWGQTGPC